MSEPSSDSFDQVATDYEAELQRGLAVSGESSDYFAQGRMEWLKRCLAKRRAAPQRALDYGCGTGNSAPYFFDTLGVETLVGVDVSSKSLEVARAAHTRAELQFAAIEGDAAPGAPFDLAFCNGVFHHIEKRDRAEAMRYIAASVGQGGYFAFWENNPWSPAARYVMSRIPFDRDAVMVWPREARRLMRAAGFEVLSTHFLFVFPSSLSALRGSERLVSRAPLGAQYQVLARRS